MQHRSVMCRSEKEGEEGKLLSASACDTNKKPVADRTCNLGPCTGMRFDVGDWEIVSGSFYCSQTLFHTLQCSRCNDTIEKRTVKCVDSDGNLYPKEKCLSRKRNSIPIEERSCATPVPCVYKWHASEWSKCSTTCGHGHQERKVFCAIEEMNEIKVKTAFSLRKLRF